ncbi:Tfp pilus assembly protein FimT/FimU [Thermoproteota archaeon]
MMTDKSFTIIELVMVMLIVGILAAVAASQIPDLDAIRITQAANKIQSDIRFAQRLAMQTQRRTAVIFDVAQDSYSIWIENTYMVGDIVKAINPATQQDFDVYLNTEEFQGVDITYANFNSLNYALVFDRNGDPYGVDIGNPPTIALITWVPLPAGVVLNFPSVNNKFILVMQNTGRVNVQDTLF